jgi:hypothetical protein
MKVVSSPTLAEARMHARYCEGDNCCEPDGEVRIYPLLFAARVILCRACWERENGINAERSWAAQSTGQRGAGRRPSAILIKRPKTKPRPIQSRWGGRRDVLSRSHRPLSPTNGSRGRRGLL